MRFDLRTPVSLSSLQSARGASAGSAISLFHHRIPPSYLQDSSRSPSVDGDLLANHTHHNQKRNSGSGRRHNAKSSGSNNVQQTDESFRLLESGKNKSDNDDDVAGNFRYEASFMVSE